MFAIFSKESFAGLIILVVIAVAIQLFFVRHVVKESTRRWLGISFLVMLILEMIFFKAGQYFNIDLFGYIALAIIMLIWMPITYNAKSMMMEIWMSMVIGFPVARYLVMSVKNYLN